MDPCPWIVLRKKLYMNFKKSFKSNEIPTKNVLEKYFVHSIERSPTQPCKGGQLPQESYVSHSRVGHFRHLFSLFPRIDISFYYLFRFSRHTRTYCKNSRVKMYNIEICMGLWKSPKLDLECLSFFLLTFQFPRFVNTI